MSKQRKVKLIIAITAFFILIVLLLLLPFRAWTRATLANGIVRVLYEPSAVKLYDKEFLVIHNELVAKGFQLIDQTTLPYNNRDGLNTYAPLQGCQVNGYQGIHETITCQKVGQYKPKSPQAFKALWSKQAASIENLLERNGWQKEYSDQPDYTDLFDTPGYNGNWLTYIKNQGKIKCELTVAYNPPYPNPDDQIWIHEQCVREVKFFGGY